MDPQDSHIRHAPSAGYARAEHAEPDYDGPHSSTSIFDQEDRAKPSNHNWSLEIAALLLCICTMASIVILLFFADNQLLAKFDTSIIPFNGTVSILSTIARVSLGFALGSCLGQWKWNWFRKQPDGLAVFESFEDASRGPWGSFTLVAKFNVRHWATLGAFVTVTMLGFEPFLQSIIQYEGSIAESLRDTPRDSPNLSWSDKVDTGMYRALGSSPTASVDLPSGSRWVITPFSSQPDLNMVAAMYNGFSQSFSTAQQAPLFSCTTGNCTWPIFTSISVCSRCNDVTDHLEKKMLEGEDQGTIKFGTTVRLTASYTEYSLPYLSISNVVGPKGQSIVGLDLTALMTAKSISNQGRTLSFKEFDTMITAVGVIKADTAYANGGGDWNDSLVTATECALFICAKAYNSRVDGGLLTEDTIAFWASRVHESYRPSHFDSDNPSARINEFESVMNHSIVASIPGQESEIWGDEERSDLQLQIPVDEAKARGVPDNATLVFNLTQNTVGSMGKFINFDFFQKPGSKKHDMVWPIAGNGGFDQAPVVESLWKSSDISVTFSNAALALSNWLRDSSGKTHTGTTQEYNIYIRVQWSYLSIPLAVVTAGCVFILLSMWETKSLRLPAWRSNVISTLTHSLDADSRATLRQAEMEGVLKTATKKAVVYLGDANDGLELKLHMD